MNATDTYAILYLEINFISVLIIGIIRYKTAGISKMVAQRNFAMTIDSLSVFFLSDTFYVMMKCGMIPYSKIGVMVSKELYFFSTALMCFFWFVYFEHMQDSPFVKNRKRVWFSSALVWVMGILLVVNLFNGIFFYVDENNVYQRGPFFILQYIVAYFYVFFSCSRALLGLFQKKNLAKRKTLLSLALFPIAPAGAGILQFIYPNLPLACAALAIATLIMYLNWLDEMISLDPLTRLNNRKQMSYFYEQAVQVLEEGSSLSLLMIDANKFKQINDTYGHIQGDAALVRIADALWMSCDQLHVKANLSRYGGDEFAVFVWTKSEGELEKLQNRIRENLKELNQKADSPYELTVSIGIARVMKGMALKDAIEKADELLYEEKEKLKGGR